MAIPGTGKGYLHSHRLLAVAVCLAAAAALVTACAYGFSGSLPSYLQTVKVIPFRSRITEYGLEQDLTSRITEMLVRDGRLAVVTGEQDCEMEGSVTYWARTPYSYTSGEQVEEYKLEIRVELTFTDLIDESDILNSENVSSWVVYDPETESEDSARNRLLEETAEDIVGRCLSGW